MSLSTAGSEDPAACWNDPPMGFGALRRLQSAAATYARLASPDCAASTGFLSLTTLHSATDLSALFHADPPLGFGLQRFPSPGSRHASRRALSSLSSSAFAAASNPTSVLVLRERIPAPSWTSRIECTRKIRSRWAAVTRSPSADPLLTLYPPRYDSSVLDPVLLRSLLSWASQDPDM